MTERYVDIGDGEIIDMESGESEHDFELSYLLNKRMGAADQRDSWENVRRGCDAALMRKMGDRDQAVIDDWLTKIVTTPSYKIDGEKLADRLEEMEAPRDLLMMLIRAGLSRENVALICPEAVLKSESRAFLRINKVRKLAPGSK